MLQAKSHRDDSLRSVYAKYVEFLNEISDFKIIDEFSVKKAVEAFNDYRGAVLSIIEARPNSGQENIRSSMLEEFFCHLFSDLIENILDTVPTNLVLGKATGYVDLAFTPSSFKGFFLNPRPYVHTKDQDFILGATLELVINDSTEKKHAEKITIPFVAIECKTYLEKNMLDSCSGTASRLKSAMPYCMYIVASEYMKMKGGQPELSDINEIYILCKASNAERLEHARTRQAPHEIQFDLIQDLYLKVMGHLNSIWWAPEKALQMGKVINRP